MSVITIIGAGMMGSALSFPARDNGHTVRLVGTPLDREIISRAAKDGWHPTLKRRLPDGIEYYQVEDMKKALCGADFVIGGVSSFGVDWFSENALPLVAANQPVLSVTKGMVDNSDGSMTPFPYLLESRLPAGRKLSLNAIGGPCTSYELADRNQSCVAFCGRDIQTLRTLRDAMKTDYYHISVSTDVVGVEFAVALKNAYALGISLAIGMGEKRDGMGSPEPYNTEAALFGQSVREIRRLLRLSNAGDDNIVYAAGDLYVTVFGGRTRKIGTLLGRGLSMEESLKILNGVTLESLVIATRTARAVRALIAAGKVSKADFPLLLHVDDIINRGAPVDIPWEMFTEEYAGK